MFDAVEVSAAYRTIVSGEGEIEELLREHGELAGEDVPIARPALWAAHTRGVAAWVRREYPRARQQLELARERCGELSVEPRPALWPLSYSLISAEPETGYPLFLQEDTALLARRVDGERAAGYILVNLAAVDRVEGDLSRAEELIGEALANFRRLEDRQGEAYALNAFGNLARSAADFERGRSLLGEALALRQEIGDRRGNGITLGCLAMLLARSGDAAAGRAAAGQARDWFAENDDLIGLSAAELSLAAVALHAEDPAQARAHLEAAASVFSSVEAMHQTGWALAVLSAICAEQGDAPPAARWLQQAVQHFELLGGAAGMAYCRGLEKEWGLGEERAG
jgi:tetratricopeptide (TPR) repeat protein